MTEVATRTSGLGETDTFSSIVPPDPMLTTTQQTTGREVTTIYVTEERGKRHFSTYLAPFLFLLGAILWLIGSALFVASAPRLRVNSSLGPGLTPQIGSSAQYTVRNGKFIGTYVLWIIASSIWVSAALLHMLSVKRQTVASSYVDERDNNIRYPGISRWAFWATLFQLAGTILVLIGSCFLAAGSRHNYVDLGYLSTAGILLLIGFTLWAHALLIIFAIGLVIGSMVPIMPSLREREYSWRTVTSSFLIVLGFSLIGLACVNLILRDATGYYLTSALLFLCGSIIATTGLLLMLRSTHQFYIPVWHYTTKRYLGITAPSMANDPLHQRDATLMPSHPTTQQSYPQEPQYRSL